MTPKKYESKNGTCDHRPIEKYTPRTDIASRRKLTGSQLRGVVVRGKPELYDHRRVEAKWQKIWERGGLYTPDLNNSKKKFYNLWMFPYPSAEGLHAGHAFASTGSDVYGRFMRMKGFNVFQPIGYDSFGIHSENFALKINDHPGKMIKRTTKHYEEQLRGLGHAYDWTRTVTTSDIDYYRWTQLLFVKMFKAGLAYKKKAEVNWCPSCKTVLADEQVVSPSTAGKIPMNSKGETVEISEGMQVCERCGTISEKKELEQWFFKITDYADELLEGLSEIKWPEKIKIAQRNWIGRKEWIDIGYPVDGMDEEIVVSTTRPDTNYGATFIVISPEHGFVQRIINSQIKVDNTIKENISLYVQISKSKSDLERVMEGKEKTGVFTGIYAINRLNGYKLPIYIADFVLMSVGTGVVVGVPGHDRRDFLFAKKFNLPIKRVVVGNNGDRSDISKIEQVCEDEGVMINSDFLDGMDIYEATQKMMDHLESRGWGKRVVRYHLRDWLISRQRYWGPPIPMIFCENCKSRGMGWFDEQANCQKSTDNRKRKKAADCSPSDLSWDLAGWYPVSEDQLPVVLPAISDFQPEGTGKGPLAKHSEFYKTMCPRCGNDAVRETDVSDTFLDSAWYFLRYPSVETQNSKLKTQNHSLKLKRSEESKGSPWSPEITHKWLPVDLYFGGAEHAVLHLMYSRFVWKMLIDEGLVDKKLGYEPFPWFYAHGLMIKDGAKMSKSRGNVVNPDEYIEKFGADTLRLYLMFMGPMDGSPDFRDTGIEGMRRFVEKVWQLFENFKEQQAFSDNSSSSSVNYRILIKQHQTIKKVTEDIGQFKYNTAISAIMEYVNALRELVIRGEPLKSDYMVTLTLLLAPFTPHLAEEVWKMISTDKKADMHGSDQRRSAINPRKSISVHTQPWPTYDPKLIIEEKITIPIQVNGKLRGTIEVGREKINDKNFVLLESKGNKVVQKWIAEGKVIKEIYVPGRLVNFVVSQ